MTQTIKTIQVETISQLKTAKALKKIATKLFNHDVAITFETGDIVLKQNSSVQGVITYNEKLVVTADTEANLLAVGTQALLRFFYKRAYSRKYSSYL